MSDDVKFYARYLYRRSTGGPWNVLGVFLNTQDGHETRAISMEVLSAVEDCEFMWERVLPGDIDHPV